MVRFADHLTSVADVLLSTTDDGEIRVNLGDTTTGEGLDSEVPVWGVDGFVSVPNEPDDDGAAQAFFIVDGHERRVVATRDNRWAAKAGTAPAPGDRFIVSNCAARVLLKRAKSSVTLYTENQQDGDTSQLIDLNGADGTTTLICGGALVQMSKDRIVLGVSGGGMIVLDANGVQILGPYCGLNTGGGNIGVDHLGNAPPPTSAVIGGTSGQTGIASPSWTVVTTP